MKLVLCATKDEPEAEKIAKDLLDLKLAACIQLLPIKSRYVWQGKLEKSDEILMLIKCKDGIFKEIEQRIVKLHSYEVPEIIELNVTDALPVYLDWVNE